MKLAATAVMVAAVSPVLASEAPPAIAPAAAPGLSQRLLVWRFDTAGFALDRDGVRVDVGPTYENLAAAVAFSPRAVGLAVAAHGRLATAEVWSWISTGVLITGLVLVVLPLFTALPFTPLLLGALGADLAGLLLVIPMAREASEGLRGVFDAVNAYNVDLARAHEMVGAPGFEPG